MRPDKSAQAIVLLLVIPIGILGLVAHIKVGSWLMASMFATVTTGAGVLALWLWRSRRISDELEDDHNEMLDIRAVDHVTGGFFGHLVLLIRFAAGARQFVKRTAAEAGIHSDSSLALRRICRRNVALAGIGLILGLVIVPTTPLWIGRPLFDLSPLDAQRRSLGFLFLGAIFSPASIYWGIAVGCLLAPVSFFNTVVGQSYQRVIGTASPRGARIVCSFLALLIPALWVTFVMIFLRMAPLAD